MLAGRTICRGGLDRLGSVGVLLKMYSKYWKMTLRNEEEDVGVPRMREAWCATRICLVSWEQWQKGREAIVGSLPQSLDEMAGLDMKREERMKSSSPLTCFSSLPAPLSIGLD